MNHQILGVYLQVGVNPKSFVVVVCWDSGSSKFRVVSMFEGMLASPPSCAFDPRARS